MCKTLLFRTLTRPGVLLSLFFFKQKTAYEMRISDWSSDVCSSDLVGRQGPAVRRRPAAAVAIGLLRGRVEDARQVARLVHQRRAVAVAPDLQAPAGGGAAGVEAHLGTGRIGDGVGRSEERRVGKECASTSSARWSLFPIKKNKTIKEHTISSTTNYI